MIEFVRVIDMKIRLLLILLIIYCVTTSWGQNVDKKIKHDPQEITIKKLIIVNDLENQLKDVPLAAVRVLVRSKMASWLWKSGKDETGNAEQLSVKAIEELYEKKTEIPSLYFNVLKPDLFALLELNAKETATKLKAKYDPTSEDALESAYSNLSKKDGERLAADKILRSLIDQSEFSPMATLLMDQLQNRQSAELPRILTAIVNLEETGRNNFSVETLFLIVQNFRSSAVPNDIRIRFFKVILNKAGVGLHPSSNVEATLSLLSSVMPDITVSAPNLLPEAHGLLAALTSRASQATREARERNQRIEESPDKLSALISEAEKSNDKFLKYRLHTEAAQLALRDGKFRLAVDLAEKTIETEPFEGITDEFRKSWHDQFLSEALQKALKKDDVDSAKYATKKVIDKLSMAELLRKTAIYYSEKQNMIFAAEALDEAIKLTTQADDSTKRIYGFIRLVPTTQRIDKSRVSEVAAKTAKAIDKIPTLNVEDKPGTENFEKYVISVMAINWNLLPVISELAKANRNEAVDFAGRISRKEIRIVADYALLVDLIRIGKIAVKAKVESR